MPAGACLQRALDRAAADAGGGEHGLAWHLAGPSKPAPCWMPWGPSQISAAWIGACVHIHPSPELFHSTVHSVPL